MLRNVLKSAGLSVVFLFMINVSAIAEERFGGVGLSIAQLFDPATTTNAGELIVLDVLAGDAKAKGVMRGDVITKIGQTSTNGVDFGTLVAKLRGDVGSEVVLEVKRAGEQKPLTFRLKRSEIVHKG